METENDFKVFRKDDITNIQIKPELCVFKGFILCAKAICSDKYFQDEINFIKQIFIENVYDENHMIKIGPHHERNVIGMWPY